MVPLASIHPALILILAKHRRSWPGSAAGIRSGFTQTQSDLYRRLHSLEISECPSTNLPATGRALGAKDSRRIK